MIKFFRFLGKQQDYEDRVFGHPMPIPADKLVILLNSAKDALKISREKKEYVENMLPLMYQNAKSLLDRVHKLEKENERLEGEIKKLKGTNK